jgi:hypothetical protein
MWSLLRWRSNRERLCHDAGQAMAEYAIATMLSVVIILALWNMYQAASNWGITEKVADKAPFATTNLWGLTRDLPNY